jgi:hypothetical protein
MDKAKIDKISKWEKMWEAEEFIPNPAWSY